VEKLNFEQPQYVFAAAAAGGAWGQSFLSLTSEQEKADDEIIEIYRGLWKIEESFKVTKSDLETRPVYLSREERIQAHFLICFAGLTFAGILERRFEGAYSFSRIGESLCSVSCSRLEEN
jgi:transposase